MGMYRVLVVDDNHEVRRMVTASIKTLDPEIDVLDVPSAEEALLISASLSLDLVILDYRLPGMSGVEMISRLRKRRPETKIILVTGVGDAAIRKQVAESQAEAYFYKPIDIAAFLEAVRHCLWPRQDVPGVPEKATRPMSGHPGLPGSQGGGKPQRSPSISLQSPDAGDMKAGLQEKATVLRSFQPTLGERLFALQQQVRAVAALLVDTTGQVSAEAGDAAQVTSLPQLLAALLEAARASLNISDVLGKIRAESIQYFTHGRQRIVLAPVDPSHALIVLIMAYLEPDKLGMLDRAIHLAVDDLRTILESMQEQATLSPGAAGAEQADLPAEVVVDADTQAGVEGIFSRASITSSQEDADGFWEKLGENGGLDGVGNKNVLSYDQARELGLAPDDAQS